jgi:hypothetical protein
MPTEECLSRGCILPRRCCDYSVTYSQYYQIIVEKASIIFSLSKIAGIIPAAISSVVFTVDSALCIRRSLDGQGCY